MENGELIPIRNVKIGDRLHGSAEVTTTYLFDGSTTKMVRIYGVHMSANHYIQHEGQMIHAGDHPDATHAGKIPLLWCLATTTNRIPIVTPLGMTVVCADYEESSDPAIITEAQRIAEMSLNGGLTEPGPTVPDYSLGLDPTFTTLMKDGSWKQLDSLKIGDALANGIVVTGIIREVCDKQVETPDGFAVSAAQLIYYERNWRRAAHIGWKPVDRSTVLCQIMVSNNMPFMVRGDT
jgi:hypothetical protein